MGGKRSASAERVADDAARATLRDALLRQLDHACRGEVGSDASRDSGPASERSARPAAPRRSRAARSPAASRASRPPAPTPGVDGRIAFAADLVRAIRDGRKTVTRRPARGASPPFAAGEVVTLAEPWAREGDGFVYAADASSRRKFEPGRSMPADACRTCLRVTSVRRESLSALTAADARAEGCPETEPDPVAWFRTTWDRFYGRTDFASSRAPDVWVIEFEIVRG
jgi:hypothetical protein